MGRKDLSEKRRNQILDAFERCVVEYGLSGASLTKVAEQAGINRGMIHHYIGDRSALLSAFMKRRNENITAEYAGYLEAHQGKARREIILNYLFDNWSDTNLRDEVIFEALVAEAARDPYIHQLIVEAYDSLAEAIARELKKDFPNAPLESCQSIAYAITALESGNTTMVWLGFDRARQAIVRDFAEMMMHTLEEFE